MSHKLNDLRLMPSAEVFERINVMVPGAIERNKMIIEKGFIEEVSTEFDTIICNLFASIVSLPDTDMCYEVKEAIMDLYSLNGYLELALNAVMSE